MASRTALVVHLANDGVNFEQLQSGDSLAGVPSVNDAFLVVGTVPAELTHGRQIAGTTNEIILTDGGAGSTLTLSLPQAIATTSGVTFGSLTLGTALGQGQGGTAATTSAGARTNLGVPSVADAFLVTGAVPSELVSGRQLVGTTNQVIFTDGGAGSTLTLSLPQSIATTSGVTFGSLTLGTQLGIGQGGTNATTSPTALTNLGVVRAIKVTDQSVTNSAVLVADNTLTFNIGATGVWYFYFFISMSDTSAGTNNAQYAVSAPTGATVLMGGFGKATGSSAGFPFPVKAAGTSVTVGGQTANTTVIVEGTVTADGTHSGAVTLEFAQGTAGVGQSAINRAGSSMVATQIQ